MGKILQALKRETVKSKLREAVMVPIKELRAKYGKDFDKAHLPEPLRVRVQDVLAMK